MGGGLVTEPFWVVASFTLEFSSSTIFATLDTACAAPSLLPLTTACATSAAAEAAFIAGVEYLDFEICCAVAPATAAATALEAMRLICSATFSSSVVLLESVFGDWTDWRSENSTPFLGLLDAVTGLNSSDVDESRLALFST